MKKIKKRLLRYGNTKRASYKNNLIAVLYSRNGDKAMNFRSLIIKIFSKQQINLRQFKKGKLAIHCNTEDKAKRFLIECDKRNIKIGGAVKASLQAYNQDRNYYYYLGGTIKGLVYDSLEWIELQKLEIKEYI